MTFSEAIGRAVVSLRLKKGLSQRQLAARCGDGKPMQRTYISKVEGGICLPSIESIQSIASGLEVKPSEIISLAEDMKEGRAPFPEISGKMIHIVRKRNPTTYLPIGTSVEDPIAIARRREIARKLGTLPGMEKR